MANLSATYLLPLIEMYSGTLDKNEYRFSRYGALETFKKDTASAQSIWTADTKNLIKNSWGNTVKVPVINYEDVSLSTTRSCAVVQDENTSALVELVFGTISWGFSMVPHQYGTNYIKYDQDKAVKQDKFILKVLAELDTLAYNNANTARNQVWSTLPSIYTQTGNSIQVPPSLQNDFYNYSTAIFESMDFYSDRLNVIASTYHRPEVARLMAQGAGNSINEAFQFNGFDWAVSNRVPVASGKQSTIMMSVPGTYAFETRLDAVSNQGFRTTDGTEWGKEVLPGLGFEVGVKYSSTCTDQSGLQGATTAHMTAVPQEYFTYSFDYCFQVAYNSAPTTRPTPIIKAEFLTAEL